MACQPWAQHGGRDRPPAIGVRSPEKIMATSRIESRCSQGWASATRSHLADGAVFERKLKGAVPSSSCISLRSCSKDREFCSASSSSLLYHSPLFVTSQVLIPCSCASLKAAVEKNHAASSRTRRKL